MVICENESCTSIAKYGKNGHKYRCRFHRLETDSTTSQKICGEEDCGSSASYGLPYKPPTRCGKHKLYGFVDVKNKRCSRDNCMKIDDKYKRGLATVLKAMWGM